MALPKYDKNNRRKNFEELPKGAYVVKIIDARIEANKNSKGEHITMAYDIAEGEYKDYFRKIFDANTNTDKKWSRDGMFYLNIPTADSPEWLVGKYDSFMGDLEESNGDTVIGDVAEFKGKVIGGKFANEQSEYNGKIYDHMRMVWTCTAQAVRDGKAGKLPSDQLVTAGSSEPMSSDDFIDVGVADSDRVPF